MGPLCPLWSLVTSLPTQHRVIPSINKWRRDERGQWKTEDGWSTIASNLFSFSLAGLHYLDHRAHTPRGAHVHTYAHIHRNTHARTHRNVTTSMHWYRCTFTYPVVQQGNQFVPLSWSSSFGFLSHIDCTQSETEQIVKKKKERKKSAGRGSEGPCSLEVILPHIIWSQ